MTLEQWIGAWLLFAGGFVACFVMLLIYATVSIAKEERRGGARGGRSRPEAGCTDGLCRRGEGTPRRVYDDAMVNAFLLGEITLDDMRKYHNGRTK